MLPLLERCRLFRTVAFASVSFPLWVEISFYMFSS